MSKYTEKLDELRRRQEEFQAINDLKAKAQRIYDELHADLDGICLEDGFEVVSLVNLKLAESDLPAATAALAVMPKDENIEHLAGGVIGVYLVAAWNINFVVHKATNKVIVYLTKTPQEGNRR